MTLFNRKNNKGFTLIELLVVISIIGLLSSIVLASLNDARKKGKDAAIKQTMRQFQNALELYRNDNAGNYPGVFADGSAGNPFSATTFANYMKLSSLPTGISQYVKDNSTTYGPRYGLLLQFNESGKYNTNINNQCLVCGGRAELNCSGTNWFGLGGNVCKL
jgi:prepilin-type N-terminal cleavage/methylation domain-containing protein